MIRCYGTDMGGCLTWCKSLLVDLNPLFTLSRPDKHLFSSTKSWFSREIECTITQNRWNGFARVYSIYVGWFGTFFHTIRWKKKELEQENLISGQKFSKKYHLSQKKHETNENCKQMVITTYSRQLNLKAIHKSIEMGATGGQENPISGTKCSPKSSFGDILRKKWFKTQVNPEPLVCIFQVFHKTENKTI